MIKTLKSVCVDVDILLYNTLINELQYDCAEYKTDSRQLLEEKIKTGIEQFSESYQKQEFLRLTIIALQKIRFNQGLSKTSFLDYAFDAAKTLAEDCVPYDVAQKPAMTIAPHQSVDIGRIYRRFKIPSLEYIERK